MKTVIVKDGFAGYTVDSVFGDGQNIYDADGSHVGNSIDGTVEGGSDKRRNTC